MALAVFSHCRLAKTDRSHLSTNVANRLEVDIRYTILTLTAVLCLVLHFLCARLRLLPECSVARANSRRSIPFLEDGNGFWFPFGRNGMDRKHQHFIDLYCTMGLCPYQASYGVLLSLVNSFIDTLLWHRVASI